MIHDWNQSLDDLGATIRTSRRRINSAIGDFDYDAIVVPGDLSGLVVGSPLSIVLDKPLVIVRVNPHDCPTHHKDVIGDVEGKRLLYVDDQISSGQTFAKVEHEVEAHGGQIVASYEYQFDTFTKRR